MSDEKTRYEISADELESRIEKKKKIKDEPCEKAVEILQAGLESVLKSMGVDVDVESTEQQQEDLGIVIWEHTDESQPQLNGFYIHRLVGDDPVPVAFVGSARIDNSDGKVYCEIHWFNDERTTQIKGPKILQ